MLVFWGGQGGCMEGQFLSQAPNSLIRKHIWEKFKKLKSQKNPGLKIFKKMKPFKHFEIKLVY